MAKTTGKKSKDTPSERPGRAVRQKLRRWVWRPLAAIALLTLLWIVGYRFIAPPTTLYMAAEKARLGELQHSWVDLEDIAPVMARSVVAAEDANFCTHWGFDMAAIRAVIEAGETRGASTISQQTVKNVFLWPARSWPRKALEALLTPVVEAAWPKKRILEVYLNMIEFDEGVFGVGAAASWYFGTTADQLTAQQAAQLAAVLPAPKDRSASRPGQFTAQRARSIRDGAETIRRDGRSACFED